MPVVKLCETHEQQIPTEQFVHSTERPRNDLRDALRHIAGLFTGERAVFTEP